MTFWMCLAIAVVASVGGMCLLLATAPKDINGRYSGEKDDDR